MWMEVKYEPGTVKVVAFDKDGKPAAEKTMKTAGSLTSFYLNQTEQPSPLMEKTFPL